MTISSAINLESLISIFFFVAGVELGYEVRAGWLSTWRTALSAVIAAVAGMVVPALIYVLLQTQPSAAWITAVATDLPIALIVLSVFGKNLRPQVRTFLLALAIVDDVLSVVLMNVVAPAASGSHLTLLAICIGAALGISWVNLAVKLVRYLQPVANVVVVPIFVVVSIANSVDLQNVMPTTGALGLVLARIIGKTVGISVAGWLLLRLAPSALRLTFLELLAVGASGSIGLTVSLLFAQVGLNTAEVQLAVTNILLALVASIIWTAATVWLVNRRTRAIDLRAQLRD